MRPRSGCRHVAQADQLIRLLTLECIKHGIQGDQVAVDVPKEAYAHRVLPSLFQLPNRATGKCDSLQD